MRDHLSDYWIVYALILVFILAIAWLHHYLEDLWLPCLIVFGCVLGAALFHVRESLGQERWEAWCRDRDGHVESESHTSPVWIDTGYGSGYVNQQTITTYRCRSADGTTLGTRGNTKT